MFSSWAGSVHHCLWPLTFRPLHRYLRNALPLTWGPRPASAVVCPGLLPWPPLRLGPGGKRRMEDAGQVGYLLPHDEACSLTAATIEGGGRTPSAHNQICSFPIISRGKDPQGTPVLTIIRFVYFYVDIQVRIKHLSLSAYKPHQNQNQFAV